MAAGVAPRRPVALTHMNATAPSAIHEPPKKCRGMNVGLIGHAPLFRSTRSRSPTPAATAAAATAAAATAAAAAATEAAAAPRAHAGRAAAAAFARAGTAEPVGTAAERGSLPPFARGTSRCPTRSACASSAAAGAGAAVTGRSASLAGAVTTGRSAWLAGAVTSCACLASDAGSADSLPRTLPARLAVAQRIAARRAAIPVRSRPILVGSAAAVLRLVPPLVARAAVDVRVPIEVVVVVDIDVVVSPAGIPAPRRRPTPHPSRRRRQTRWPRQPHTPPRAGNKSEDTGTRPVRTPRPGRMRGRTRPAGSPVQSRRRSCFRSPRFHDLFRRGFQIAGALRLDAHALHGLHHIRFLRQERVAELGRPLDVVCQALDDIREARPSPGCSDPMAAWRPSRRASFPSVRVFREPLLELNDFERIRRCGQGLGQQRVRIECNRRDERIELVRRCKRIGGPRVRLSPAPLAVEQMPERRHRPRRARKHTASPAESASNGPRAFVLDSSSFSTTFRRSPSLLFSSYKSGAAAMMSIRQRQPRRRSRIVVSSQRIGADRATRYFSSQRRAREGLQNEVACRDSAVGLMGTRCAVHSMSMDVCFAK